MAGYMGTYKDGMATDSEACLGSWEMHGMDKDDVPSFSPFPSAADILAFQSFYAKMANNFGIKLQDPEHRELQDKFWKDVNKLFYPHLNVGHLVMLYTAGPSDFHKIVLPEIDQPSNKKRKRG